MNKLLCGIDLPLSTIFQSVPGSLLHPGTQTDAEMTNKQTNKYQRIQVEIVGRTFYIFFWH